MSECLLNYLCDTLYINIFQISTDHANFTHSL